MGVLVEVLVGITVALGRGVVLGEGVGGGVRVALGMTIGSAGNAIAWVPVNSTLPGLHPAMIKKRNSQNSIPTITLIEL